MIYKFYQDPPISSFVGRKSQGMRLCYMLVHCCGNYNIKMALESESESEGKIFWEGIYTPRTLWVIRASKKHQRSMHRSLFPSPLTTMYKTMKKQKKSYSFIKFPLIQTYSLGGNTFQVQCLTSLPDFGGYWLLLLGPDGLCQQWSALTTLIWLEKFGAAVKICILLERLMGEDV